MKFDITKKLDLGYLGAAWKDCFIEFRLPTYGDLKNITSTDEKDPEALEKGIKNLENLFVSGKAVSESKVVILAKENLRDFPLDVLTKCFEIISGKLSPKQ